MDFFPGATSLLKRVIHKKVQNSVIWWSGICFFKGLCLLFYPSVPGTTFIQGATLIPEPRVVTSIPWGRWRQIFVALSKKLNFTSGTEIEQCRQKLITSKECGHKLIFFNERKSNFMIFDNTASNFFCQCLIFW